MHESPVHTIESSMYYLYQFCITAEEDLRIEMSCIYPSEVDAACVQSSLTYPPYTLQLEAGLMTSNHTLIS